MKEILLTRGMVALVDDDDYPHLSHCKWFASKSKHTFYAVRTINLSRQEKLRVYMHREILGLKGRVPDVDHINGNGLDNRRSNIRPCSRAQNARNMRSRRGSSGFKGVSFHRDTGKWAAYVRIDGRQKHLGVFDTEHEAALAYDVAAKSAYGDFAKLNFPEVRNAV